MARLAKLDSSSGHPQWCFRNVALPQIESKVGAPHTFVVDDPFLDERSSEHGSAEQLPTSPNTASDTLGVPLVTNSGEEPNTGLFEQCSSA